MRQLILKVQSFLILLVLVSANVQAQKSPVDMDRFIDDLMKRMTLEEKIGQLNLPVTGEITTGQAKSSNVAKRIRAGEVGGLFNLKGVERIRDVQKQAVEESRLGIPLLFGMDVIHGYETVFPIPLGLSCTWNMKAIEESARIAAIEASADGICWTFSPMVDVSRDPRWGRVSEGNGEDPFLGAEIARAMVRGYQGKDMSSNDEIMACVKHFALYGASEAGRDYNTVDMSHQRMFNEYMLPYQAAVEEGVGSVMASFNEVDGVPATGNKWLMTDVLRKQWNFDGFVVTDYTGITEMTDHGMGDTQTVAALALNAGVDMDMVSDAFTSTLKKSLEEGKVSVKAVLPGSNEIGSQYAQVQGCRGAGEWNLGWGQHTPTQLLADAFEEGDPRKDETLLYFIRTGEDPSTIPANKPYGEKPIANADVIAKYFNKKVYTDPALREKYTKSGYWVNIRLIRYSDVVLMAAEAACELGDNTSARRYLEMIRARARGMNANILPEVTTDNQSELREAIRHERRVELGMEFDRFYDLVRWGIAKEVLHAAGKTGYQDKHALLPLPQDEIDKSNGVLVQNPNY